MGRNTVTEFDDFYSGANEGNTTSSLGSVPLVVLSRDPDTGVGPGIIGVDLGKQVEITWGQMPEEFSHRSTSRGRLLRPGRGAWRF
jgi:hypothetical protein